MKLNIITLVVFLTPLSSMALLELRATYGALGAKNTVLIDACGSACTGVNLPSVVPFTGLGADLIISPPILTFGFGARYEKLALRGSASGIDVNATLERAAILINYRLIDTIIHLGAIGTFGVSTQSQLIVSQNGVSQADFKAVTAESASLGLELGIKPLLVIPISVGAEAGYQLLNLRNVKDNVSGTNKDIDLSGVYLKVFAGFDL